MDSSLCVAESKFFGLVPQIYGIKRLRRCQIMESRHESLIFLASENVLNIFSSLFFRFQDCKG